MRRERSNTSSRWLSFKVLVLLALILIVFDGFFGTEIGQENVACQSALREEKLRGKLREVKRVIERPVKDVFTEVEPTLKSFRNKLRQRYKGLNVVVHQIQLVNAKLQPDESTDTRNEEVATDPAVKFRTTNDSKYGKALFGKSYSIIYNAVPKTASRSLETSIRSVFNVMNLTNKCFNIPTHLENSHNESDFTSWFKRYDPPAFIRGHALFAPVKDPSVVYINIVREPTERLISHFYFDYYGDAKFPKNSTKVDLKKCILTPGMECHDRYKYFRSVTLEAICGYETGCSTPSNFSLERAKRNLEGYTLIGLTEDMESTLKILEMLVPGMLAGLNRRYNIMAEGMMQKFKTENKDEPDGELMDILRKELAYEYEFYNYAKSRFEDLKRRFLG